MKFKSVDIGLASLPTPEDYVRLAQKAEKYGFECLWLQEGTYWSPIVLASLVLAKTSEIKVGTGIVSTFKRHPETLASDAATLSEYSRGRFILGIGSGGGSLEILGMNPPQLRGMREATEILRRLFNGEQFVYSGRAFRYNQPRSLKVKLGFSPPIHIGALGPKMIELASEVADGLLISRRGGSNPGYVKWVLQIVRDATARWRKKGFTVRSFFETSISRDRKRALDRMREVFVSYTLPMMPPTVLDKTEVDPEEVKRIVDVIRGGKKATKLIGEKLIGQLSLTGTPEDCVEKLHLFTGIGLDSPILYIHGPDPEEALELAGKDILPEFT